MNGLFAKNLPASPFLYEAPVQLGDNVEVRAGVRILKHTYINSGRIHSGVYIGRYCSIGNDVTIGTSQHDMSLLSTSSWFTSLAGSKVKRAEPDVLVRIKNDVWIGDKVIIMGGVTIGNGAVLGAGSIVTHDVPDYAIVCGVPSRFLRWRFEEDVIERLLKLKWWEFNDQVLRAHKLETISTSLDLLELLPDFARTDTKERLIRI